ncbi:MAG: hypothetical protein JRN40_00575 [Nitrososphaerota archaeon]|jgi:hypothetical protein|nr:hypothetical protein [Nitrososphaerota archaeon]MDG6946458.1 hypothetical protein [Nitrososphaerota archaeon]MDG6947791.1 hypothetical protein [Nitrososphaerota archaeon]
MKPDLPITELRTPKTALRLRNPGESPGTNLLTLAHMAFFERELSHSAATWERKSELAKSFAFGPRGRSKRAMDEKPAPE